MMNKGVAIVAVGIMAVASCSHQKRLSLTTIGSKLNCHFVEEKSDHELFTKDQGSCGKFTLYLFASNQDKDDWIAMAHDIAQSLNFDDLVITNQGPTWLAVDTSSVE